MSASKQSNGNNQKGRMPYALYKVALRIARENHRLAPSADDVERATFLYEVGKEILTQDMQ